MGRANRVWVSQEVGCYHVISRVVGKTLLLHDHEKNYFLKLLERLASGYFVRIHAFAIMGNHFHILLTVMNEEACFATRKELMQRYQAMCGENEQPPQGRINKSGEFNPYPYDGLERLRERLGSLSEFMKELKKTFTDWYNKNNDREGFLWSDRFKSLVTYSGDCQLICSSYIDLNPVRAGIAIHPEDYRWSSVGMRKRNPSRADKLLHPLSLIGDSTDLRFPSHPITTTQDRAKNLEKYLECLYFCGGIEDSGSENTRGSKNKEAVESIFQLGFSSLSKRIKNLSKGIAIGDYNSIHALQAAEKRKHLRPRKFLDVDKFYTTRVLRT